MIEISIWAEALAIIAALIAYVIIAYVFSWKRWERRLITRMGWKELQNFNIRCIDCPDEVADSLQNIFASRDVALTMYPEGISLSKRELVVKKYTDNGDAFECYWETVIDHRPLRYGYLRVDDTYEVFVNKLARNIAYGMGSYRAYLMRALGPNKD